MEKEIIIAKSIPIRNIGEDEYWLQDQIYDNPKCLGLGDLIAVERERQQSSGGKMDILLKNQSSDTMYEVEVMLGDTDPDHIVRTIEYWDNEKRRFPQRKHFAVLIAENINKRFFNVIHLLSHFIPIIAIQVSLIEDKEKYFVHFSTVLNTYEEIDDGTTPDGRKTTKDDWIKKANWMVELSDYFLELVKEKFNVSVLKNYVDAYISISILGKNCIWFNWRKEPRSSIEFKIQSHLKDQARELLEKIGITVRELDQIISFTTDKTCVNNNKDTFFELFELLKASWGIE